MSSFFIGTSPAFDFAVFTTCLLIHPGDSACQFTVDNAYKISVTSFNKTCDAGQCLATAYPAGESRNLIE
uniref:EndoU domain-containing protein n=1 Tax=Acrobeloides nanus TaxID=290746 RepID=A0A914EHS2_9BILA